MARASKKTRRHNPATYRSGLEDDTAKYLKKNKIKFEYEPADKKICYIKPATDHVYTPDFYITTKSGKVIIIETKGIWTYEDRLKHLLIKQQHPSLDIRFVFSRSKSKIRKGSSTTYADICEGKGRGKFKGMVWKYADKKIPQEWLDE